MSTVTTCRAAAEDSTSPHPAPSAATLRYSLTLPGEPYSAGIARRTVGSLLRAHRLDVLLPAATQAVGELVAAAWQSSPGDDLYLSVRFRDDALRLIAYDAHDVHGQPWLAAHCEARRRARLRVLAALAGDCGGDWGFGPSREPGGGTRAWVALPCRDVGRRGR